MINVRVYGLLINPQQQILVSDELIRGMHITKFPGGGLEYGEGTKECLVREFWEEAKLEISADKHFYTTDFFQESAFRANTQILSIYYLVHPLHNNYPIIPANKRAFDFSANEMKQYDEIGETETFRWIDRANFSEQSMTLPIDKVVAELLQQHIFT